MPHPGEPQTNTADAKVAEPGALWRQLPFRRLWVGQAISLVGSQVSAFALPLTASLLLQASPLQMGVLGVMSAVPVLLTGLFAGPWVDRLQRRPLVIGADIGRAGILLIVPLAALLGILRVEHLYAVAFLNGLLSVVFEIAYGALLPQVLGREHLVAGNSALETGRSVAEVAGPGLAGLLITLLGAPLALIADACSFLVSALSFWQIAVPEQAPASSHNKRKVWSELREGLRMVWSSSLLRMSIGCAATVSLGNAVFETLVFVYVPRELGVSPNLFGLILSVGSLGSLGGAVVAERLVRRVGLGRVLMGALLLLALGDLVTPLAQGPTVVIVLLLVLGAVSFGLGVVLYRITQVSMRQALTPVHLQGRVSAVAYVATQGMVPMGALLGGVLGEVLGLRATLLVAGVGEVLALGWVWFTPLGQVGHLPRLADGEI